MFHKPLKRDHRRLNQGVKIQSSKPAEAFRAEELMERLKRIERKVDALAGRAKKPRPLKGPKVRGKKGAVLDVMALLSIPDHLRKSALAIVKLGRATAADVAEETGRSRAIESAYLNQLVRMGYLKSGREGRTVYFQVQEQPRSAER